MTSRAAGSLTRAGTVLAVATTVANLLGYGLVLVLTRTLPAGELGAAGALLNLAVIGMVPAVAVQLVVARTVARHDPALPGVPALGRAAVLIALEVGLALAVAVAVAAPVLERFLHLDGPWAALWVGAWLVPATVVFAVQGLLQGRERFLALSAVLVLAAAARPLGGAGAAALDAGVATLLALVTGLTAAAAVVALRIVRSAPRRLAVRELLAPAARRTAARLRGEVAGAALSTAGLLTLANVDLLLARHVLDATASGMYAVGALFAKGAFWAPQFVSTLLYPRMAQHRRRARAVAVSVVLCAVPGLLAVLVTVPFGSPLAGLVAGDRYRSLGPLVPLFVGLGAALAVAQVLVYARLALGDRRLGVAAWVCVAGLVAAVLLHPAPTLRDVAWLALAAALALVAAGLVLERTALTRR